jgi:hypothetical protein
MTRFLLTQGPDLVVAVGAHDQIDAPSDTLSAGDVLIAAPWSDTSLVLEDGNHFDLSAPLVMRGIHSVYDHSVGDSVITLRDGLDLTLHLGGDSATVYGAHDADTIIGGPGGFATIYLGSARETVVAGTSGASVVMQAQDAGARIDGRGVTTMTLTGQAGERVHLGAEVRGVGELDVTSGGLRVNLRGAGIAAVALSAQQVFVSLSSQTTLVTDYAGGNTIRFTVPGQTLRLANAGSGPGLPADHVLDFGKGDTIDIDLPYGAYEELTYDPITGDAQLTDSRSGVSQLLYLPPELGGLTLAPDTGLPDGDTGTLLSLGPIGAYPPPNPIQAPCFAAGTRVLSERGWVAVEALAVGDVLITRAGQSRVLRWIGHRGIDCRRHAHPVHVQPVQIEAEAFGAGLPSRAIHLSPDHAVFVDEVLIPVKYLVNGATIRQVSVERVRYFHLELDSHDVVLAEGLAVESYLDTGNRHQFANTGTMVALHARFAHTPGAATCAPLVTGGPIVQAVRARLLAIARQAGHQMTTDPDLHLCVGDQRIWGRLGGDVWRCWVPPDPSALRIVSRASAPADCELASDDRRRLGVALAGLTLRSRSAVRRIGPDDAGWGAGFFATERDAFHAWRWSDGNGHLDPALWRGIEGPFQLDLHLFATLRYRLPLTGSAEIGGGAAGVVGLDGSGRRAV